MTRDSRREKSRFPIVGETEKDESFGSPVVLSLLLVGIDPKADPKALEGLAPGIWFAPYPELADRLAQPPRPDMVLSPVIGQGFDLFDIARIIRTTGYRGKLRGLSDGLPRPQMILAELRAEFPDMDINIYVLGEDGSLDMI